MRAPSPVPPVLSWYAEHRRDLPWRAPGTSAWAVLVSEVMLQQTPVDRVVGPWRAWLERWPTPADLADSAPGDAVRAWGRLGYPRRALNLHRTATAVVRDHGGRIPEEETALRALPGVGEYTAAAVRAFAFGRRSVVLDTNIRRVLARHGQAIAGVAGSLTAAERARAAALVPADDATAAAWSAAVMELGACVCTAARPACQRCPIADTCAWRAAGHPPAAGARARSQAYAGTDRQVRGLLLGVLREHDGAVTRSRLDAVWPDAVQRARALDALVADGLVEPLPRGRFRLPA